MMDYLGSLLDKENAKNDRELEAGVDPGKLVNKQGTESWTRSSNKNEPKIAKRKDNEPGRKGGRLIRSKTQKSP